MQAQTFYLNAPVSHLRVSQAALCLAAHMERKIQATRQPADGVPLWKKVEAETNAVQMDCEKDFGHNPWVRNNEVFSERKA